MRISILIHEERIHFDNFINFYLISILGDSFSWRTRRFHQKCLAVQLLVTIQQRQTTCTIQYTATSAKQLAMQCNDGSKIQQTEHSLLTHCLVFSSRTSRASHFASGLQNLVNPGALDIFRSLCKIVFS